MYTLPKLPYEYNAFEHIIDEDTMVIHHTKHHQTYVDNFINGIMHMEHQHLSIGKLLEQLQDSGDPKKQYLINNGGGHYNHTFYWYCMSPSSDETELDYELKNLIHETYGDLIGLKEEFNKEALKVFGSGWQWLCYSNKEKKLKLISSKNQDNPGFNGEYKPILGCDLWEHAYYLKYNNRRGEYLKEWWRIVDYGNMSSFYEVFAKEGKFVDFESDGTILRK